MVDDRETSGSRTEATTGTASDASPVAYCQECGRGLMAENLHRTANGVFCMACSTQPQPPSGWQAVSQPGYPGAGRPGRTPGGTGASGSAGDANPVLAGLLGFIPGVGAMYNGQYAKGAMHLIVFVILVSLADNLNWVFYWLVWGWVFYQAFDAYHTARARRDGAMLPNPFGWNDVGERLGFTRGPLSPPPPVSGASYGNTGAQRPSVAWTGYVPPTAPYAQAPPTASSGEPIPQPQRPVNDNPYAAPYVAPYVPAPLNTTPSGNAGMPHFMANVPYTATYVGTSPNGAASLPVTPMGNSRFPVGAIWLIGLGIVFLLGNLLPEFRLSPHWMVPLFVAALAVWMGLRRWQQLRFTASIVGAAPNLAGAMKGPLVLLSVAFLLALNAGDVLTMRRSWPVILVVWGGMLILQRATSREAFNTPPQIAEAAPPPVRSTSGTGSLGL